MYAEPGRSPAHAADRKLRTRTTHEVGLGTPLIADLLRERAECRPDDPALVVFSGPESAQTYDSRAVYEDTCRSAIALREEGIEPGDLVILASRHQYELLTEFLGAICLGAVPTVFPYFGPTTTPEVFTGRLAGLGKGARARAVITEPPFEKALEELLAGSGCLVKAADWHGPRAAGAETISFEPHRPDPAEPAYVQFSSGSTAAPRGVVVSHRAVLENIEQMKANGVLLPSGVYVNWAPLFHDMGLVTQVLAPLTGDVLSVMIPTARWMRRPELLFQAIDRYRGAVTWMPNFAFHYCLRRMGNDRMAGLDLSSMRILGNGAEPVDHEVLRRFADRFAPYGLRRGALTVGYGMAENVLGISATPLDCVPLVDWISRRALDVEQRAKRMAPDEDGARAIVSCGRPLAGTEVRIADKNGSPLPERRVGEVLVRGPSLFSGYYAAPELTSRAFRDGWFRTGDLAYLADGRLYVCGREKDLIVCGGNNVQPHLVERIAAEEGGTAFRHVAAFGIPDETIGTEIPVVVCEMRAPLDDPTRRELGDRIVRQVSTDLDIALADVRFVERGWVVRTTSGKTARALNRQKYIAAGFVPVLGNELADTAGDPPIGGSSEDLESYLTGQFERLLGVRHVGGDDDFFELGGHSLSALRLVALLEEEFEREIPIGLFFERPTARCLAGILANSRGSDAVSRGHDDWVASPRWWRSNHLASRCMAALVPYAVCARLLRVLCSPSWIWPVFFRRELRVLRSALPQMGGSCEDAAVLRHHLTLHCGHRWRIRCIDQAGAATIGRWTTAHGMEHLLRAQRKGNGVLLVAHHNTVGTLTHSLLRHLGIRDCVHVGAVGRAARKADPRYEALTAQSNKCRKALERGGVALTFGDGRHGSSAAVSVPFLGRDFDMKRGFAELAVLTNAETVPVFSTLDIDGSIHLTLFAALDTGCVETPHEDRVRHVIGQYAELLEQVWTETPANVPQRRLREFLSLPQRSARRVATRALREPLSYGELPMIDDM